MTLTEVSFYSRKLLPFALVFFLLFLIIFYLLKGFFIYLQNSQPHVIYTNTIFDKLKKPYVKEASTSAGYNFTLDTVEGEPVTATSTAKVFLLPPNSTKFGYREKIYLIAKTFGFDTEKIKHKLVDAEASFADEKQKLSIDVSNFNFKYAFDMENNPQILDNAIAPTKKLVENKAIDFLKSVGRYPDELTQGTTNITFLSYDQALKQLTILDNNIKANLAEIDFYRPNVDNYTIVTSNFPNSQNYVLLAMYDNEKYQVVRAQMSFFEKSEEQVGTYPLITGNQAYENLKTGEGFVLKSFSGATKNVRIRKMFLGYYDPDIYQDYLQPVYVFLGDNNFVGFVPAVSGQFLGY